MARKKRVTNEELRSDATQRPHINLRVITDMNVSIKRQKIKHSKNFQKKPSSQ
jgi:hypothetical protein